MAYIMAYIYIYIYIYVCGERQEGGAAAIPGNSKVALCIGFKFLPFSEIYIYISC